MSRGCVSFPTARIFGRPARGAEVQPAYDLDQGCMTQMRLTSYKTQDFSCLRAHFHANYGTRHELKHSFIKTLWNGIVKSQNI